MKPTQIQQAIQVFVHGFGFTRSFTHPYVGEKIEGETPEQLWVIRDAPRKNKKYRTEEWVGYGLSPAELDRLVSEQTRGKYAICTILDNDESDEEMRAEFKELGYRLNATEPLMVHSLDHIPTFDQPATIERVTTKEQMEWINKVARSRQVLPEHLPAEQSDQAFLQMPIRQYIALIDGELIGRVASIPVNTDGGPAAWVSNMYVMPEYRRRGIARSLLSQMLQDDHAAGESASILLSSHTGAMLYPVVGYEQIGTLYIYTPTKGKS